MSYGLQLLQVTREGFLPTFQVPCDENFASLVDHFCGEKNLIFDLAFDYTYFSRVRNVVAFSFFLLLLLF